MPLQSARNRSLQYRLHHLFLISRHQRTFLANQILCCTRSDLRVPGTPFCLAIFSEQDTLVSASSIRGTEAYRMASARVRKDIFSKSNPS
jgi:hypothetical protein